jgi:hypothetical protein
MSWVWRLLRWVPATAVSQELVRFETQALENPEISGTEYQQGTLFGYEVREYLLEKWAESVRTATGRTYLWRSNTSSLNLLAAVTA